MNLKPLRQQVLIRLDDENRMVGPTRMLFAPDVDSILWCRKCGRQMEAIRESACVPEVEFGLDARTDAWVYRGESNGHQIEAFEVPIVVEKARMATVIVSGSPDFDRGERIVIDFASGRIPDDDDPSSPYRLVFPEAILARVEEEEEPDEQPEHPAVHSVA